MNKTLRYTIYGAIVVLCVIAIIVGVYGQIHVDYENRVISQDTIIDEESFEDIDVIDNENFKRLLYDKLLQQDYDTSNIKFVDTENHNNEILFNYNVPAADNVTGKFILPVINIKSDVVTKLNEKTVSYITLKDKVLAQAKSSNSSVNMEAGYAAYIKDDILSIAIRCSYKIGTETQVVMISSYNYDIKNDKLVTMNELIDKYSLDKEKINEKIAAVIKRQNQSAKDVVDSGYQGIYMRKVDDDMYKIENSDNFLLGEDGRIYVIYSYGENYATATYDVIEITMNK